MNIIPEIQTNPQEILISDAHRELPFPNFPKLQNAENFMHNSSGNLSDESDDQHHPEQQNKYFLNKKRKSVISSFGLIPFYIFKSNEIETNDLTLNNSTKPTLKNTKTNKNLKINTSESIVPDSSLESIFRNVPASLQKNYNHPPKNEIKYNKNVLFLIQQRRDTFEYVDYLTATWGNNLQILINSFTLISEEERQRIRNYTFRETWEDTWIDKSDRMYIENYERCKRKYDSIKKFIPGILDGTISKVTCPPWGFPKGRKNGKESEIDCATRETEEETRIPKSKFKKIYNNKSYSERFQGTNGLFYSTTYFLCEITDPYIPPKIMLPNAIRKSTVSEEVSEVLWVTYEEACKYLDSRKQAILFDALSVILAL